MLEKYKEFIESTLKRHVIKWKGIFDEIIEGVESLDQDGSKNFQKILEKIGSSSKPQFRSLVCALHSVHQNFKDK